MDRLKQAEKKLREFEEQFGKKTPPALEELDTRGRWEASDTGESRFVETDYDA